MYLTPVRSSKKVSDRSIKCNSDDITFEAEEYEPSYQVSGYYHNKFYGLAEDGLFDNASEAEDYVWKLVNDGLYTVYKGPNFKRYFSPDQLEKSVEEFGEVYDITDAEIQW